jgi:hypothetical protein
MRSAIDAMQFNIMDGVHIILSLQRLQKNLTVPDIQEDFLIQVKVIPE